MQRIEKDKNSKYTKLKLDYTYGLDKITIDNSLEKNKLEPEFEREYNLKYLGKIDNVFSPLLIDRTIKKYEELNLKDIPLVHEAMRLVGIDPGFGSSNTAIVVTEHLKNPDIVRVNYAEEFEKANPQDIVNLLFDFHAKFHPNIRFLVDGSNAGFVRQLKVVFDGNPDNDYKDVSPNTMVILPVNFGAEHKQMLSHLYMTINKEYLTILEKYDKLIVAFRIAQAKEYSLHKEQTSYNDLLDGLRLSLKGYSLG